MKLLHFFFHSVIISNQVVMHQLQVFMDHKVMVHLLNNNSNFILEVLSLIIRHQINNQVIHHIIKEVSIHLNKVIIHLLNKVMVVHRRLIYINNQILTSKNYYEYAAMNEQI